VASGHVGTPASVVAGLGEFARTSAHPPAMMISAQSATSANLRRPICVPSLSTTVGYIITR
jgi:hypothetical protein